MSLPLSEHVREGRSLAVGYQLQEKHIALELTKKIRADRQNLLSNLRKRLRQRSSVPVTYLLVIVIHTNVRFWHKADIRQVTGSHTVILVNFGSQEAFFRFCSPSVEPNFREIL